MNASPRVLIAHCDWRGNDVPSGVGAAIDGSQVVFVGGSMLGGSWNTTPLGPDFRGMDGLLLANSHVTLRGVTVRGGAGSGPNHLGGDAIDVASGQALVLGHNQLRGGAGGGGLQGAAARGDVRFTADTLLIGPTFSATQMFNRPVVVAPGGVPIGTTLQWSVSGDPSQLVWLGLDLDFGYLPLPQLDSALVLTTSAALQPGMYLDATGAGTLSLAIPNVPALRHLDVFAQGAALVGGALVLTAPAVTHTL